MKTGEEERILGNLSADRTVHFVTANVCSLLNLKVNCVYYESEANIPKPINTLSLSIFLVHII